MAPLRHSARSTRNQAPAYTAPLTGLPTASAAELLCGLGIQLTEQKAVLDGATTAYLKWVDAEHLLVADSTERVITTLSARRPGWCVSALRRANRDSPNVAVTALSAPLLVPGTQVLVGGAQVALKNCCARMGDMPVHVKDADLALYVFEFLVRLFYQARLYPADFRAFNAPHDDPRYAAMYKSFIRRVVFDTTTRELILVDGSGFLDIDRARDSWQISRVLAAEGELETREHPLFGTAERLAEYMLANSF